MSKEELLEAYLLGMMGRRGFIRGLVDAGVPLRAAAIHSVILRPPAAGSFDLDEAARLDDYDDDSVVRFSPV